MTDLPSASPAKQRGALMAIGGAEDKVKTRRILNAFLTLSGGTEARIVIIPAASSQATASGDFYLSLFQKMDAASVEVVHAHSRQDAQDESCLISLRGATGIFLTGGNQVRLAMLLGGTRLGDWIHRRSDEGVVVAGTSAGASILCQNMIAFGRTGEWPTQRMVQLAPGIGLTKRVIIDQHFQRRGRIGRLMLAVAYNPYLIGLGIDEDTAAILYADNKLEVVGRGSVIVVDGVGMTFTNLDQVQRHEPVAITDMRLHVLTEGFGYDLVSRRPQVPSLTQMQ
jgi:cyanophycinase